MLGGEGEHFHPALSEDIHPMICVKANGIPCPVKLVVLLPFGEGHVEEWPRLWSPAPNGVNTPMNANPELYVLEGFIRARWCRTIFSDRRSFDVGSIAQLRFRKPVYSKWGLRSSSPNMCTCNGCRACRKKISSVHHFWLRSSLEYSRKVITNMSEWKSTGKGFGRLSIVFIAFSQNRKV